MEANALNIIKELRKKKGIQQKELALVIGVAQPTVSEWESGKKDQRKQKEAGTLQAWIDFDIVPYTLRHAFCAFCRDSGVEMNTCRRWMGHADAKMILKVYDSVSHDREQSEREKVEKKLIRVRNGVQDQNEEHTTVDE